MQVAKISSDNKVEEIGELKTLFSNTSFTKNGPNADWYTENSVMPVTVNLGFNPATQKMISVDPYIQDNIVYTVRVVDLTTEEQKTYTDAQTVRLAATSRDLRDRKLADTDWMAIKAAETGVSLADNWKAYRQALRDLPTHKNWPNLVSPEMSEDGVGDWPVKPS